MPLTPRRRAAVLGSPIAHSLSPVLHRAAYAALGLDWSYSAVECDEAALPEVLDRLGVDHAGLSLTRPLKRRVLELVDDIDELARLTGAANTVVFTPADSGRAHRRAVNTDVAGLAAALAEAGVPRPVRPLVLGGGATAASAVAAFAAPAEILVAARDPHRAEAVAAVARARGIPLRWVPWDVPPLEQADVVVATVPPGASDALARGMSWPAQTPLVEVLYAPWPSALAASAQAAGATVVGGLAMLVAQAGEQLRVFTGAEPPLAAMRAAGERALRSR